MFFAAVWNFPTSVAELGTVQYCKRRFLRLRTAFAPCCAIFCRVKVATKGVPRKSRFSTTALHETALHTHAPKRHLAVLRDSAFGGKPNLLKVAQTFSLTVGEMLGPIRKVGGTVLGTVAKSCNLVEERGLVHILGSPPNLFLKHMLFDKHTACSFLQ